VTEPKPGPRIKWTIAVLTVPERALDLIRIKAILHHQINGNPEIEVMFAPQEGWTLGQKRQWCLDNAQGEYFNFIDDDDLIAHDYIDTIWPLLDGIDYVGFRMQHFSYGVKSKPTYHSLRYDTWYDDADGFYRNVSHLNPMAIHIARQGRFAGYYGEDFRWSQDVRPQTEHYIDKCMYMYMDAPKYSAARAAHRAAYPKDN
jgi:hypothetical protein